MFPLQFIVFFFFFLSNTFLYGFLNQLFFPPGVKDVSAIDPDLSLADLGLDSLMGVEIRQLLERDFEVTLSTREIRLLTIKKLQDISTFFNGLV